MLKGLTIGIEWYNVCDSYLLDIVGLAQDYGDELEELYWTFETFLLWNSSRYIELFGPWFV